MTSKKPISRNREIGFFCVFVHSEPGPKANKGFIDKIITGMKSLPDDKAVAFSTGGCLWGDNGEKMYLTEVQARTFLTEHGVEPWRDEESNCLVFKFEDMGALYEVWYADVNTLNYWISTAKEQGINAISLWRFGKNLDIDKII